jgi:hypothetical protein
LLSEIKLQAEEDLMALIRYRTADVDGFKVFSSSRLVAQIAFISAD